MGIKTRALVLAVGLAVSAALTHAQAPAPGGDYFIVQQSRAVSTVSIGGTVIPYKEVTLAAQLPGRIVYLAGIEGNSFRQGDSLVRLDAEELKAKRRAALAQRGSAVAQWQNARTQYQRELWSPRADAAPGGMGMPNLFDQMFTKPIESFSGQREYRAERYSDLRSSLTGIQQAESAIARLDAEIQQIDAHLRNAQSVAPFNGVIMTKFIEIGDTVQPGQPLLKYADVEYLQVEVDVPARLHPGLQVGMQVQAQLDVDNRIVPVRVAQIFPMADAQRHTVKVKFDLPQGFSAPGMYAKVLVPDFTAPARANPFIPSSAIHYNGSLPGVYVHSPDGADKLRLIRVGEELPGGYISVLSGLQPGEKVLRNPSGGVVQGWAEATPGVESHNR
jgi:multidrug efflux pump subunit AcrA (membrane-fusion protein)